MHLAVDQTADLSRRERRKLEVRNRILEAGVALFDQHGVDATKVAEICDRADVAHKTFFNYFPTKQQLLRDIASDAIDTLLVDIGETRRSPGSTSDRMRLFFTRLAKKTEEAGPMRRELLTEMVHISHQAGSDPEQARKLYDAFAAIIEDGVQRGDVNPNHSPETLTDMFMGAFYVLMFNWANLDDYPLRERSLATAHFLADALGSHDKESSQ